MVWMCSNYGVEGAELAIPVACLTIVVAALMVSTIRYTSFKSVDFKGKVPFVTIVLAVFVIAGVALEPPETLFGIFFLYLISGPLLTLWQLRKVRKHRLDHQHKAKRK
jgi:CDP-diacylglycerol--serine O-phosphatidyltransferase